MDDPTTARLGESLYTFIPRSVIGNVEDGVHAELLRLKARGLPFFCFQNRSVTWGVP
jgi:alkane 1-monooxygenase